MNQFIDTAFNCPTNPAAILFLVEDTDFMTSLQRSVRDSYLLMMLEAIYKNKSPSLAKALWMSTSDLCPLVVPSELLIYRQLLQDYTNFTNDRCGIATSVSILSAIKALSGTFDGAAAVRHLVVFAGLGPGFPTLQGAVPWHNAIRRLKEEDILVHFVIPTQYTGNLTTFYRTLVSEGSVFQSFADGGCFLFHLTAPGRPLGTAYPGWALAPNIIPEVDRSVSRPPAHPATPPNEPGLAHQLQRMTGVERQRRSRTRDNHPYSRLCHPNGLPTSAQSSSKSSNVSFSTNAVPPSSSTTSHNDPQLDLGQ